VTVRFKSDDFAIYNNDGKKWLRAHPRKDEDYGTRDSLEEKFAVALRKAEGRHDGWSTTIAKGFPLRWASGGCLPLVEIDSEQWVAVLFRDLAPIGWNVANGGSESVTEQTDVTAVLRREFREELIVLDEDPLRGSGQHPRTVHARTLLWAGEDRQTRHESPGLEMRRRDDSMTFIDDPEFRAQKAIEVVPRDTPWRIRVISPDGKSTWLHNTFPSIDAKEHGIEAIQIVTFRLDTNNILLDGEVLEKTDALVRRPIVLLRLSSLRALHAKAGGLGTLLSTGGKVMPLLPPKSILTSDVEARLTRNRLAKLEMQGGSLEREPGAERRHLAPCLDRHEALIRGGLDPKLQLDRLAPVTWSTLEAFFALEARRADAGTKNTLEDSYEAM